MFAKLLSMGLFGMESYMVEVEADISGGLPLFDIVGLPDKSVSEAKNRIRAAVKNSGFEYPSSRITVNLAPADVRKEGSVYDLPMLVALLMSSRQLRCDTSNKAFIGELSLDGSLKHINGALPMVIRARDEGVKEVFLPKSNAAEASVVRGVKIYAAKDLQEIIAHLTGVKLMSPADPEEYIKNDVSGQNLPDFRDVKGQFEARRALEVAAAGGHNIMMIGPPGSGKSMLAKRIPSILPDMTFEESLETTKLYSIAGALPENVSLIKARPFRSPHHTVSPAGLSGGGSIPRPGEVSLAHNGVLFLDELPEFSRAAMEILRQPVEDGKITISRIAGTLSFPCSAMLVCAMNPCPCGFFGHPTRRCTCPSGTAARYLSKVSGPLLDRLDIHIEVPPVDFKKLSGTEQSECSEDIRRRVNRARKIQQERFSGTGVMCNARMDAAQTRKHCTPTEAAMAMLQTAFEKLELSARAYDKILRVARTVADLDGAEEIGTTHIAEAIQYRSLDRKFWRV
ncbi:MAG: YifB family Mg chelatase-like AAA ATPase [Oscillospiraceae bacterium]|nr:YifB family Mg chelatase-like AAA ATPase [Oscillospiraceae bacterium]